MADEGKLKLIGKLGLDLARLQSDVNSMETLINKADKNAKALGKSMQNVAGEMQRAFKNIPIADYVSALERFEKAQKSSLGKMKRTAEQEANAERRREEKHRNTLLSQQMLYNAKISAVQEQTQQKMAQRDERYRQKQLNGMMDYQKKYESIAKKLDNSNSLQKRFNSLTDFVIASSALYGTATAMKQVVDINKEFEIGQMNLQRILKATSSEMNKVKEITMDVSKETGNSFKDIQDIENLWIRTGMANMENLKQLTEITAVGLNTAQFKDAEDSVSMLVGAVNQMADGDVSQVGAILDSWVKVADKTAVKNTRDLAEVISRTGAEGKNLGLTFHDLNAMTGILAERMAISGDKIGTGLKALFTRLQNPAHYKVLEQYGIKVTQIGENGKKSFRSIIDILNDTQKRFREFSAEGNETAMANIKMAMGGQHQISIISNLIEGWDRYKEIVDVSTSSAGFAMEQNAKITETFAKQVEILKASFVDLALQIGDTGLMEDLNGLVHGTAETVQWFNNLSPSIKNTTIKVLELVTIFGALNMAQKKITQVGILEVAFKSITKHTGELKNLGQVAELVNDRIKANKLTSESYNRIMGVLTGTTKLSTLAEAERTVALEAQTVATYSATTATVALDVALGALMIGLPILIGYLATAKQSKDELKQKTLENIETTKQEVENTDALIKEYEDLTAKTSLTNEEKNRLNQIEVEFAKIYPSTIVGINKQSQAYSNQIDVIKNLTYQKKLAMMQDAQLFISSNATEKAQAEIAKAKALQNIKNAKVNASNAKLISPRLRSQGVTPDEATNEQVSEYILKQKAVIDENDAILRKISEQEALLKTLKLDFADSEVDNAKGKKKASSGSGGSGKKGSSGGGSTSYNVDPEELDYSLDSLKHEFNMGRLNKSQYASKLKSLLSTYKKAGNADEEKIWGLEEQIHDLSKPSSSGSGSSMPKAMQKAMEKLDHEFNMGKVSDSDYSKKLSALLKKYKAKMNQEAIWSVEEKIYNAKKREKPDYKEINFDDMKEKLTALDRDLALLGKQEEYLSAVNASKTKSFEIMTKKLSDYKAQHEELIKVGAQYKEMLKNVEAQISSLDKKSIHYDELLKMMTSDKEKLTKEIDDNTQAIIDNEIAQAKLNATMEDKIIDNLREAYTLQKEMADTALENRQAEEMKRLNNELQIANDLYDSLIKKKEEELKLFEDSLDQQEYTDSIAELQKQIAEAKADTRFSYIENGVEVTTYDRQKVAELEKELADKQKDWNNEQKKKQLQDEIDALNAQKDAVDKSYDLRIQALQELHTKEKAEYDQYWSYRLSDENIKQQALQLIAKVGYDSALAISESYYNDIKKQYDEGHKSAIEGGKSITAGLKEGLFAEIDSVIAQYRAKIAELASLRASASAMSGTLMSGGGSGTVASVTGYRGTGMAPMQTYHQGGFVGGSSLTTAHEEVAKLLKGELVLTAGDLNRLSVSLPSLANVQLTRSQENSNVTDNSTSTVVHIDKLYANNFDEFLDSMSPYIVSRK